MIHRCPKCGVYFRPPRADDADCPQCGIWFHKWRAEPVVAAEVLAIDVAPEDPEAVAADADPVVLYARIVTVVLVAVWGVSLAAADYRTGEVGGSFMHNILLPIHEAGHVFLMPFGEFMATLGGSLLQVALPFGIAAAFYFKQRQPFGAAICLWWTGASLVDLSPYIWDAADPQLMLLGGRTGADGPHDWIYLLGELGQLKRAHGWGVFVHHLGVLVMVAGVAWGARYCWLSWKKRPRP